MHRYSASMPKYSSAIFSFSSSFRMISKILFINASFSLIVVSSCYPFVAFCNYFNSTTGGCQLGELPKPMQLFVQVSMFCFFIVRSFHLRISFFCFRSLSGSRMTSPPLATSYAFQPVNGIFKPDEIVINNDRNPVPKITQGWKAGKT